MKTTSILMTTTTDKSPPRDDGNAWAAVAASTRLLQEEAPSPPVLVDLADRVPDVHASHSHTDESSSASSTTSTSTSTSEHQEDLAADVATADAKAVVFAASTRRPRYASIDVLRALSQTQMVLVHFSDYFSGEKWQCRFYRYEIMDVVMFLLLSGVSFHISSASAFAKNGGGGWEKAWPKIRQQSLRRGIFLILCHIFLALVILQDPIHVFTSDTLFTLGLAQIVLGWVCVWKTRDVLMLGVLVLLLTGAVQYERIDPDLWRSDPVDQEEETYGFELKDLTLEMVFDLILCNGLFPIFPYLGYPLIGFAVGRLVYPIAVRDGGDASIQRNMKYLKNVGATLFTLSATLIIVGQYVPNFRRATYESPFLTLDGYRMYPETSFEFTWGTLGKDLLWIVLAAKMLDQDTTTTAKPSDLGGFMVRVASRMSRTSLTMYLLHHAVIFAVIRGREWWEEEEYNNYYSNIFPENPLWSVFCGLTMLVTSQFLFAWMERRKIPMIENLVRWFCEPTTTVPPKRNKAFVKVD